MKKSISLVLAIFMVAMVFATIPFSAFAAESDDDIVAKIITEDEIELPIKRSEFTTVFANGGATNLTSTAFKDKSMTIQILADIYVADAQLSFTVGSGKTITIDGDPNKTGTCAKITGEGGGNPIFRIHGAQGTVTFQNLEYTHTSTLVQIYADHSVVNFNNCNWTTSGRGFTAYTGTGTVLNFNEGTTITSSGAAVFFTDWGWTGVVCVNEGATIVSKDIVSKHANSANMDLTVNGGTLVGDITAELGTYYLTDGKLDGSFIVPADEEGWKIFLGTGVIYEDFEVTGMCDIPRSERPAATEPVATEPTVDTPAATEPTVDTPAATEPTVDTPAATEPTVDTPAATDPAVDTPAATTPADTTPANTDKPAGGGCGGFTAVATFIALICGAGAALVIKKK